MSQAFKCDRCADFYEGLPSFVIDKQTWNMDGGPSCLRNYQSPQFCMYCARDYERWMRSAAKEARS
jgi:hypothetical protein